jgi:hypothetical protein
MFRLHTVPLLLPGVAFWPLRVPDMNYLFIKGLTPFLSVYYIDYKYFRPVTNCVGWFQLVAALFGAIIASHTDFLAIMQLRHELFIY